MFENQINRLCVAMGPVASFEFLDAPFLLPLKDERDDVQTRSWCDPCGDYVASDAVVDARMRAEPAVDIMLGFSQGGMVICRYLLRHGPTTGSDGASGGGGGLDTPPPMPKGVVFAGTPDPREAFAGSPTLASYVLRTRNARSSHGESLPPQPPPPFLGGLPSLHLVGSNDTIASPESSLAFARSCQREATQGAEAAGVIVHQHAHSFPQQQSVIAAVRSFCEEAATAAAALDPAELSALAESRDMELEMVEAMYTAQYGPECLQRPPELLGGAVVTLPLLPAVSDGSSSSPSTGSASAAAVERALGRLSVRFRLPRSYPAVAPEVSVVGGPAAHSVGFERWRTACVLRWSRYIAEEVGLGTAMILPAYMLACEEAAEALEQLTEYFSSPLTGGGGGGPHAAAEDSNSAATGGKLGPEWDQDDDESRARYIAAAEAAAMAILEKKKPTTTTTTKYQQQREEDVDGAEPEGGGGGGGGGSWMLTIGLIGKPSAGKSTFFNAVTDPQSESEAARVAAFPFTTIEPNVGTGFGPLPCPCAALLSSTNTNTTTTASGALKAGFTACDAAYGHVTAQDDPRHRRHPILVKDVAGLVQGAYQGKGKGNQFLNDLCDADVLVHVVDGAGATDADGSACAPGAGSTLTDVTWVRSEVHSWIYDNLRAKWEAIRRAPPKLRTMFSGYRSSPRFVDGVLFRMGIANELALRARVAAWGPADLHLLVALYTRFRFPMVVALNKADLPTAAPLAQRLRERYPEETFVPVSAAAEWDLLTLRKRGLVQYLSGENTFEVVNGDAREGGSAPRVVSKEDRERLARLWGFFSTTVQPRETKLAAAAAGSNSNSSSGSTSASGDGSGGGKLRPPTPTPSSLVLTSTGVQDVLVAALGRCPAVLVYPVSAFQPAVPSLKHCFSFKPGTTAEAVFWAMTYARLLDGKLVRFEALDALPPQQQQRQHQQSSCAAVGAKATEGVASSATATVATAAAPTTLRKTDPLPSKAVFVRVLSNKRQIT